MKELFIEDKLIIVYCLKNIFFIPQALITCVHKNKNENQNSKNFKQYMMLDISEKKLYDRYNIKT